MEPPIHSLSSLFQQLGLDDSDAAIENFIDKNAPIPRDIPLHEASIWTSSQAAFLKDAIEKDADWAERVDELSIRLRAPQP